ncbi:MAG: hypothetical protein AAF446_01590 [Pseudomonadota bacterium]
MTRPASRWMSSLLIASTLLLCTGLITTFSPVQSQQVQQASDNDKLEALQAMPERRFNGLLEGRGMGLARIANMKGYPGPMHVLEMAEQLGISDEQRAQTEQIMQRMRSTAKQRGRELIEAERRLEALFDGGLVQPSAVDAALLEIGMLQAQVRAAHLHAHIEQARVMTLSQIERYTELRASWREAGRSEGRRVLRERAGNR